MIRRFMKIALLPALLPWLPAVAGEAAAEEILLTVPQYYAVSGVAAGDALNVRAGPDAGAEIIGTLPPGLSPFEIVAVTAGDAPWGMIVAGEGSGWVSMSYLAPADPTRIAGTPIPAGTVCTGTEPFWSLTFGGDGTLAFETPDDAPVVLPLRQSGSFLARSDRFYALAGEDAGQMSVVVSGGQYCSDGMSDRRYGWTVDLLKSGEGAVAGHTGCCTRRPDG